MSLSSEVESLSDRHGATGDMYEGGSDTGEEIEMEQPQEQPDQPHSNEQIDRPLPGVTNNYHGAYQPNYGNQYNIGHLTLAMDPRELLPSQGK